MVSFAQADVDRFLSEDDGESIVMLNLLRFQPNGGRERYLQYVMKARAIVSRYGAEIIYAGDGQSPLAAEAGQSWDAVALIRYPNRQAFAEMINDADYSVLDHLRISALVEAVLQPVQTLIG